MLLRRRYLIHKGKNMANPPQGINKSNQEAVSNKKQITVNKEVGTGIRADDTTAAEKRGECFAQSADRHILDKQPGFGKVRPTLEDHVDNRGLDTLSSDSRKAPLPSEKSNKIEIHQKYNDENIIHTPDASTVT